ncbi:MAG: hypothetical protein M3Q71_21335 [Chloroflexota bacterium]|nr:hypothetical protein [Chloroflexota bacterium]
MGTPTTKHPAVRHPRQEPVAWGSKLTPEEREWQITKLLPAVLAALEDVTDAVNADAANAAAGQTPR